MSGRNHLARTRPGPDGPGPTTLATLQAWASSGKPFCVFTCYDATTARWLVRGGVRVLLVGDSAAQLILGLDRSEKATLEVMATLGSAVRRGAPEAFVIVDYPDDLTGSAAEDASRIRRLAMETGAGAIKVEGEAESLRAVLSTPEVASVPVIAHLSQRVTGHRCCGSAMAIEAEDATATETLVRGALLVASAGAAAILLEGVPPPATAEVVRSVRLCHPALPILGCNSGNECPGHVVMLHDLLGLNANTPGSLVVGQMIADAAHRSITELSSLGDGSSPSACCSSGKRSSS